MIYSIVKLWLKSKAFAKVTMKITEYEKFKILVESTMRRKIVGRYYIVAVMVC
jgi:hypothetical protein